MHSNAVRIRAGFFLGIAGAVLSMGLTLLAEMPSRSLAPLAVGGKVAGVRLPFVANQGQLSDANVRFYSRTFGGTVYVTAPGEMVYALSKYEEPKRSGAAGLSAVATRSKTDDQSTLNSRSRKAESGNRETAVCTGIGVLKEYPVGGLAASLAGETPSSVNVHSFVGDRARWQSNLAVFETVSLGEIYRGITLRLKAYGRNVEKVFTVVPGADPSEIDFRIEGADRLSVNPAGELVLGTPLGEIRFSTPVAWQEREGIRRPVEVAYALNGDRYGFEVGAYEESLPLIIDPMLASTFLGGARDDYASALAMDASGNIYMAGYTQSADYPTTPGSYHPLYNGAAHTNVYDYVTYDYDVVISKLDASLTHLLASTYLGGRQDEQATAMQIDEVGNVYVMGYTESYNFPVTPGAFNTNFNGGNYSPDWGPGDAEVFVSKLDGTLSNLLASTFLGGTNLSDGDNYGYALALAAPTNLYVTGTAGRTNFPTTPGAYDTSVAHDVFISKMDRGLSNLAASTRLGGSRGEYSSSLAVDASGNVYVSGCTISSNFPVTAGAYQTTLNGTNPAALYFDAFVSRLDSGLAHLLASTFLGGYGGDFSQALTLDSSGNAYIAGYSQCWDFPTTPYAYNNGWTIRWSGEYDAFVSKFNPTLTTLMASTCLGGSSADYAYGLAVDHDGNVFVGGNTESLYNPTDWLDFPVTPGAYDTQYTTWVNESPTLPDAFISKFDTQLTNLLASTLLGCPWTNDYVNVLLLDSSTNIIAAGYTESDGFPVLPGAYSTTRNGGKEIFISKLDAALSGETLDLQPPANVAASMGTYTGKVQVTWSAVTNAASYEVWRNDLPVSGSAYRLATTAAAIYDDIWAAAGCTWYYWIKSKNVVGTSVFSSPAAGYCISALTPVVADFDGDLRADPGLYEVVSGNWRIRASILQYAWYGFGNGFLGEPGWTALAADFDGDRKADPAVYQAPTGNWQVKLTSGNYYLVSLPSFLGATGWTALAADFDGDGKADPAIYETMTGTWKIRLSSANYLTITLGFTLGGSGWTALAADFDGDGKADPAVYLSSTGNWQVMLSSANYLTIPLNAFLGGSGWTALAADFDGDNIADPAVYQPGTGDLWVMLTSGNYVLLKLPAFLSY